MIVMLQTYLQNQITIPNWKKLTKDQEIIWFKWNFQRRFINEWIL